MKAFAIVVSGKEVSEKGFKALKESSKAVGNDFEIEKFDAVTPSTLSQALKELKLYWTYPTEGPTYNYETQLKLTPYKTSNQLAHMACSYSHIKLWKQCSEGDEPFLILEHDAVFTKALDIDAEKLDVLILGINDPRGCTWRSGLYHTVIQQQVGDIVLAPRVDIDYTIPQGLAGNSAYIITPAGAKHMMDLVNKHGVWPNDAIMCQQLVPNLSVTKQYYTKVQGLPSTTT